MNQRPNIIFILTDDQRADSICALGNRIVKVTLSYDVAQASLLAATINEIKKSIQIRK